MEGQKRQGVAVKFKYRFTLFIWSMQIVNIEEGQSTDGVGCLVL